MGDRSWGSLSRVCLSPSAGLDSERVDVMNGYLTRALVALLLAVFAMLSFGIGVDTPTWFWMRELTQVHLDAGWTTLQKKRTR